MGIWQYPDISRSPKAFWKVKKNLCHFCGEPLYNTLGRRYEEWREPLSGVYICSKCGWWKAEKESWKMTYETQTRVLRGVAASLRELDLTDISTPLEDVRAYLIAKYSSRYTLHPHLLEETVASVFSDLGYVTCVTGYVGDGGIDIIMAKGGETIGVQVKRYRNSIEVEQLRSLAGSLVLAGITKGVFVTTSGFQKGATTTVSRLAEKGYSIELCNADEFYSSLMLVQDNFEASVARLDTHRIMSNLVEIARETQESPYGP